MFRVSRVVTGLKMLCRLLLGAIYNIVFIRLFGVWEHMGFHITRNHFYQPIPDTRTLTDDLWMRQSELVGIDMNEQKQIELLNQFSARFKEEYDGLLKADPAKTKQFGPVDSEILYAMIRYFKPKRIVEIGSGDSTLLSAQAILKNGEESGIKSDLVAIEPYPNEKLRRGFPGLTKLIPEKVEKVNLGEFAKLQENDILFIDSSHVLKTGSDVQCEYLEILPRLNKGVIVHIHDIFLPMEYPKEWVMKQFLFFSEQYLVQAFMTFNNAYEVLWAASYMHLKHPDKLQEAFSSYSREIVWPGSFWIRRKA
jgi:hypothetical protein